MSLDNMLVQIRLIKIFFAESASRFSIGLYVIRIHVRFFVVGFARVNAKILDASEGFGAFGATDHLILVNSSDVDFKVLELGEFFIAMIATGLE